MLNVQLKLKFVNLATGEHITGELGKINPQKVVPTIVDETNGVPFVLWESRAIMSYLVDEYSPGHSLYPSDRKLRAQIDRLLYFDIGTLYKSEGQYLSPLLQSLPPSDEGRKSFHKSLQLLEGFLTPGPFVCGDKMTLADISIRASLSFGEACEEDFSPWNRVKDWMARMAGEVTDYDKINREAVERFTGYMKMKKGDIPH